MALWKLTPLDLTDRNWEASSHRGMAIVRAPDAQAARDAAQRAFGVKTRFRPGAGMTPPPWERDELVKAESVADPRYDPEGPTEVLEPSV
ncbi:MAG TPA: hypothetical protein VJJ77_11020 [Dongiaceae bacterium]|nr:hypothetical protein [Dongiaceae bacterium]